MDEWMNGCMDVVYTVVHVHVVKASQFSLVVPVGTCTSWKLYVDVIDHMPPKTVRLV